MPAPSLTRKSERVIVKPQLTDLASARFAPCARQGLEIEGERPRPIFQHARASPKGTKELIWVHGRRSGDMMTDGMPGMRAGAGCGRSFFPGRPPRRRVATGRLRELAGGHQLINGQGTHTTPLLAGALPRQARRNPCRTEGSDPCGARPKPAC